jgi:hypothetical protein
VDAFLVSGIMSSQCWFAVKSEKPKTKNIMNEEQIETLADNEAFKALGDIDLDLLKDLFNHSAKFKATYEALKAAKEAAIRAQSEIEEIIEDYVYECQQAAEYADTLSSMTGGDV